MVDMGSNEVLTFIEDLHSVGFIECALCRLQNPVIIKVMRLILSQKKYEVSTTEVEGKIATG